MGFATWSERKWRFIILVQSLWFETNYTENHSMWSSIYCVWVKGKESHVGHPSRIATLKAKSRSYQCLDERQCDRLPVKCLVLWVEYVQILQWLNLSFPLCILHLPAPSTSPCFCFVLALCSNRPYILSCRLWAKLSPKAFWPWPPSLWRSSSPPVKLRISPPMSRSCRSGIWSW